MYCIFYVKYENTEILHTLRWFKWNFKIDYRVECLSLYTIIPCYKNKATR